MFGPRAADRSLLDRGPGDARALLLRASDGHRKSGEIDSCDYADMGVERQAHS